MHLVDDVYIILYKEIIESVWTSRALAEAAILYHVQSNPRSFKSDYVIIERSINVTRIR